MSSQTILVTGATGAQGGSVATHLLASGKFKVKALTRNPDSEKAAWLKEKGAEIVQGDMNDLISLENAMQGCYGVFGVTNFWEHFGNEHQLGKNIIDAAVKSGVQIFVLSTLPGYEKLTNGKLKVPHVDIKYALQEYASVVKPDTIFFHPAYYYENFLTYFAPQKNENGDYAFGFPQGDTKLAGYAVEDTGGLIAAIFNHPENYSGKVVPGVGDDLTGNEYATIMTKTLGKPIHYNYIPNEIYAQLGFPGAEELGNMFEVQRLYIPQRQKDLELSRSICPAIQTFEQWMAKNKNKFAGIS